MTLSNEKLRSIPLFQGLSDSQLGAFAGKFTRDELATGDVLCRIGEPAQSFYVLSAGEVVLNDGSQESFSLHAPSPLGELGVFAEMKRNATITAVKPSVVWRIRREAIHDFLQSSSDIAAIFYANLTRVIADKISRDQRRLEDMRRNIIRTQKKMKSLREFVLEAEDTPVSERIHDALEEIIGQNRRVNYRVSPPQTLPSTLRIDGDSTWPIIEVSRTHLSFQTEASDHFHAGDRVSGVMSMAGPEMPVSGRVLRVNLSRVTVELDLMIDEYAQVLEGFLSRIQMVDYVI